MKTSLLAIGCALALAAASVPAARADDHPDAGHHDQDRRQEFSQRKAEILQRIGDHLAEMQKRQACVQAASDWEGLRNCRPPERREGDRGPDGHGPDDNGHGGH